MVQYRRNYVPGGTYFLTLTLRDRSGDALVRSVDALRNAFDRVRRLRPFRTDAVVVLPDHLHLLCSLPEDDCDFSERVRLIKRSFTESTGRRAVWQSRFWEHTIRDEHDFERHVDYIHFNPVKHGYVQRVVDWPHSSFHRDVRRGIVPSDWGGGSTIDERAAFGE